MIDSSEGGDASVGVWNLSTATRATTADYRRSPFYFVNEVTFAFTILPILIYIFSKYILPKNLRRYASRVFVSKL